RAQNRLEQAGSLPLSELQRDRRQNFTAGDFFAPLLNLVTLNAQQQLGERTSLSVNGFARTLDTQQFNVNLIGASTRSFGHTVSAGGVAQIDHDTRPFDRANRLTVGLEYAHHDAVLTTFDETAGGVHTVDSKVHDDQHAWAVYAQDTLDVARGLLREDDQLVLTVATRFDWVRHQIGAGGPFGARQLRSPGPRALPYRRARRHLLDLADRHHRGVLPERGGDAAPGRRGLRPGHARSSLGAEPRLHVHGVHVPRGRRPRHAPAHR